jgi:nitrogen fixation/metabolism regulation signal transduction histidine kinase
MAEKDAKAGGPPPEKRGAPTIPTRIFVGFLAVIVAFGVVSVASVREHQRTSGTLRLIDEDYLPVTMALVPIQADEGVFETYVDRVEERDPSAVLYMAQHRRTRRGRLREVLAHVERAEAAAQGDDRVVLREVRRSLESIEARWESDEPLFDALDRDHDTTESARLRGELRRHEADVNRSLRRAVRSMQDRIELVSGAAAAAERQSIYELALLTLLAVVAGLATSLWARRLILPLTRLRERVVAVARGDLSRRFEGGRDDEIGQLAGEFERMVGAVAARDQRLRDAATELRELQRMQEQIVTSLRAAVIVVEETGAVRTTNAAAAAILGIRESDHGATLAALGIEARLPSLAEAIRAVAHGEDRATLIGAPLAASDGGAARSVDVLVTPFGDAAPTTPGARAVLLVVDDVTDELRTKERLIQTERLAAMGRMAAHVTHEVRNPLSSIGLNVEMLEEEIAAGGPETGALLRAIQREVDRLTKITEEYLRIARLPAPRLGPEDPGQLVRDVARFVSREMESTNVRLEVDVETNLPLVPIDEAQIRQSLLNLLRNAREAMPGGGTLVLGAHREDDGVAISVRDEGEGIPDDRKERVFDVFFSTKERGTGLGLPLTREIVVAHRGRVRCEDAAPNGEGRRGTVFTIWLPTALQVSGETLEAPHAAG